MNKKIIKQVLIWAVIILLSSVLMVLWTIMSWKHDMEEYSPVKLQDFLEECFMQDVEVEMDMMEYFMNHFSSDYIVYLGEVTLDDGAKLSFNIYWEKGVDLNEGVFTEYGTEMAEHYAEKYGISYTVTSNWINVNVTEAEVKGDNPLIKQFLTDLWESTYIQSGQELEFYIESEVGVSYHLEMSREEPLPYGEIYDAIAAFIKNSAK